MNLLEDDPKEMIMAMPVKYIVRWVAAEQSPQYFARIDGTTCWSTNKADAVRFKTKEAALDAFGVYARHDIIITEPVIE